MKSLRLTMNQKIGTRGSFALCVTVILSVRSPIWGQEAETTHNGGRSAESKSVGIPYSEETVAGIIADAGAEGDSVRGAAIFAAARSACLSCHRVGTHGGTIGPELTAIGRQRKPHQIVESVFWPKREVKPEFTIWQILTADGKVLNGYKVKSDERHVVLRELTSNQTVQIRRSEIDEETAGTTPMPDELTASMSRQEQLDLIRFLSELNQEGAALLPELDKVLAHSQMHGPAEFPFERAPLQPTHWPNWTDPVNEHRLYEFYTKQAEHFRKQHRLPMLLTSFLGLDGGDAGHWGYASLVGWDDDRWNDTELGSVQSGVFRGAGAAAPRAVCVRLGDQGERSACFNPDTLTYEAVWSGGFVKFSPARHGFLDGLRQIGISRPRPGGNAPDEPFRYRGFYRFGNRVLFAYRIGETEYLDAPWVEGGQFTRKVAPADRHPLRHMTKGGAVQWPQVLSTAIKPGDGRPYAVDTIELPFDNPWKALMFCGGHDFLSDGSAVVCTIQGDVWRVTGLDSDPEQEGVAQWRRIAAGLHHALGLVVVDDQIYVQCRDQLTRLHDLNGDGEMDFYECFSDAFETSPAGHDFVCGLERDSAGNFYAATGNQGLVRISADGEKADVLATGLRNSDGLALLPNGTVTLPCSEGEWTPASMICAVHPSEQGSGAPLPHFGYRGPLDGQPPALPLAYIPRGLDNSSGGQTYVSSERWGPLHGQLVHFSFGQGSHFLVLRDEVDGQWQGAVVPLVGDFRSGAHRGRFRPQDGQLYVSGMDGWVSFTPDDGCFQRVRYTGDAVQVPIGFHVHQNGVRVDFSEPIDRATAEQPASHFAQCWNYRYSEAYGSPEYSTTHPGVRGHDPLAIASAHVQPDGRSLFLEIPDLQPVSQLHLMLYVNEDQMAPGEGHDLFVTAHKLDRPFAAFPGYMPREKTIAAHPLLTDMALSAARVPNPWRKPIDAARPLKIETGKNLTFATTLLHVRAGEPIRFTLSNPDVVPHNWVLVRPGALRTVGQLANLLISDPEAVARHYVPETDDVLAYTDIVPPGEEFPIFFRAPMTPGRYPYLCTFPGHWMVMNGVLVVEE
jgi:putative heme-binding domain-containing protein